MERFRNGLRLTWYWRRRVPGQKSVKAMVESITIARGRRVRTHRRPLLRRETLRVRNFNGAEEQLNEQTCQAHLNRRSSIFCIRFSFATTFNLPRASEDLHGASYLPRVLD